MAAESGQHGGSQNGRQVGDPDSLKRQKIEEVISELVEGTYKSLHDKFKQDLESYPDEGMEFVFHNACKYDSPDQMGLRFIQDVIVKCLKLEPMIEGSKVLEYLFKRQNKEGFTPFHVAIESHGEVYLKEFLEKVKVSSDLAFSILVNARDSHEWSPIHKIITKTPMLEVLGLVKEKVDWSAVLPGSNATALHLAIYFDSPAALDIILKNESTIDSKSIDGLIDVALNTIMERSIVYGNAYKSGKKRSCRFWSPLQLAAIMGNPDVVGLLLKKIDNIYDSSKRNNHGLSTPKNYDGAIPALHLAAAPGVPELVRMFTTDIFDPTKLTSDNRTPIHFAIDSSTPKFDNASDQENFLRIPQNSSKFRDPFANKSRERDTDLRETNSSSYGSGCDSGYDLRTRPACISMWMQAGVNTWQKDKEGLRAEPGPEASTKLRMWWCESRAADALAAKRELNDAASAVSVVAALVATASYVGPFQPPLGYGTSDPSVLDLVQTTKFAIRLFVVTNCLSFYLAIGSILLAVVPSLPKPHLKVDRMYEEWQRTRQTICIAILFLLLSIVGILVSFAAASNAGMEDYYSWRHWGLSFYPTILGSLICSYGIITFFLRLLRLAF